MSQHTFYYKILDAAPPNPLPESLPPTDLDANDGFIHLSTAKQTPVTADLFFSKCSKLWILKLRVKDIDGRISFPSDLPGCPHVHDSQKGLGSGNVEAVIEAEKAAHNDWASVSEMSNLED